MTSAIIVEFTRIFSHFQIIKYPAYVTGQFVNSFGSIWVTNDRRAEGRGLFPGSLDLAGRLGLGIDAYVTENFLVNLEIDMGLSTTRIHNPIGGLLDNLFYIPIQFGVQYHF